MANVHLSFEVEDGNPRVVLDSEKNLVVINALNCCWFLREDPFCTRPVFLFVPLARERLSVLDDCYAACVALVWNYLVGKLGKPLDFNISFPDVDIHDGMIGANLVSDSSSSELWRKDSKDISGMHISRVPPFVYRRH